MGFKIKNQRLAVFFSYLLSVGENKDTERKQMSYLWGTFGDLEKQKKQSIEFSLGIISKNTFVLSFAMFLVMLSEATCSLHMPSRGIIVPTPTS